MSYYDGLTPDQRHLAQSTVDPGMARVFSRTHDEGWTLYRPYGSSKYYKCRTSTLEHQGGYVICQTWKRGYRPHYKASVPAPI